LVLQFGQSPAAVVIYIQPAAVITGKIVDSDGDPMSSVAVTATRVGVAFQKARHNISDVLIRASGASIDGKVVDEKRGAVAYATVVYVPVTTTGLERTFTREILQPGEPL
jgi:hypothetical protein